MTNRERMAATLEHRAPDRTPYEIGFTERSHSAMVSHFGDPDFAARLGNCLTTVSTEPEGAWREVEPHIWLDQFGVRWNRSVDRDIGVVCNRAVTPANVDVFALPDPRDPSRYRQMAAVCSDKRDRFVVANIGFSLYERAWTLAGMEEFLMAMACDPAFAHALMDRILAFNLEIIERACAYEIDAMMFGDDWGQQTGVVMGRRLWREFVLPRVRQMYGAVRARGKYVFIHSCGKVDELFPDLIEAGLNVFNPFQPEVIDVEDAKRRYGRDLAFFGGISTQRTLPYGTPQMVRDEVRRLIEVVGRDGGYIAAPAHAIPGDAAPANIAAMIEALQSQ